MRNSGPVARLASLGRSRWLRGALASVTALGSTAAAHAGGFVAPIVEFTPPPAIVAAAGAPNYWLALIPLALLYFASRGGSDGRGNGSDPIVSPPGGLGEPCFCDGTLIRMADGWVSVEEIRVGDTIFTSKGPQEVLAVASWQPIEFRDRPCLVDGVRMSANHGVLVDGFNVPAQDMGARRGMIDGSRYHHILLRHHAWLSAKADAAAPVVQAESLLLTKDIKLARSFPDLVDLHAADPAAPRRPVAMPAKAAVLEAA